MQMRTFIFGGKGQWLMFTLQQWELEKNWITKTGSTHPISSMSIVRRTSDERGENRTEEWWWIRGDRGRIRGGVRKISEEKLSSLTTVCQDDREGNWKGYNLSFKEVIWKTVREEK